MQPVLDAAGLVFYQWDLTRGSLEHTPGHVGWPAMSAQDRIASYSSFLEWVHEDDRGLFEEHYSRSFALTGPFELDYRVVTENGDICWIRDSGMVEPDETGLPARIQGVWRMRGRFVPPATARTYDMPLLTELLSESIAICQRDGKNGTFLVVWIENLEMVARAYGHETVENLISRMIEQLGSLLPPGSYIQRLQFDQLGIVMCEDKSNQIQDIAHKIHHTLHHFGRAGATKPLHLMTRIGSVSFPSIVTTPSDAYDKANLALRNPDAHCYASYEPDESERVESRRQLELASYLRTAIEENRLRLAFQPIVQAQTGKISYYECLLRLVSPSGELTSAGVLIPIAEQMGLVGIIDRLVLDMTVKELRAHEGIRLAFNVSNLTTINAEWMQHLENHLDETPHIAERMIVEITETSAQRDLTKTAMFVANLQALGVQVALDDFGSGYTSFRQLKALSVDIIKIDGHFIQNIVDNADNRFFIRMLLDFARGYGLKTVAECVEHGDVAKMLMELGVEYLQGFYFGKAETHRGWLSEGEYRATS